MHGAVSTIMCDSAIQSVRLERVDCTNDLSGSKTENQKLSRGKTKKTTINFAGGRRNWQTLSKICDSVQLLVEYPN